MSYRRLAHASLGVGDMSYRRLAHASLGGANSISAKDAAFAQSFIQNWDEGGKCPAGKLNGHDATELVCAGSQTPRLRTALQQECLHPQDQSGPAKGACSNKLVPTPLAHYSLNGCKTLMCTMGQKMGTGLEE